jgi:hypothetical protein
VKKNAFIKALCFVVPFFISSLCSGQSTEIGLMGGISSYKGDLNESLFQTENFHPAFGLNLRRCFNNHWSFTLTGMYGRISAEDSLSDVEFKLNRNLSFRSDIIELSGRFEFNFFPFQTSNPASYGATPFLFAGVSAYRFNPKANLNDEWVELQPLATEGQGSSAYPDRKKYKRIQVSLPLGGGFKFRFNKKFGMAIEMGARKTYTDYLDDVSTTYVDKSILASNGGPEAVILADRSLTADISSNKQRGVAGDNDWYMFAMMSVTFSWSKKYTDNCSPFRKKLR